MKFLKNISIFAKLIYIQMITAILVVFIVSSAFVYVYFQEIKISKVENLKSLAKVIATNVTSALIFEDNATAYDIIKDLKSKKEIFAVEIRDKNKVPPKISIIQAFNTKKCHRFLVQNIQISFYT